MTNLKNTFFILIALGILYAGCGSDDKTTSPGTTTTTPRSGIFFHHSTGECIWGPNGSNTTVPQEITTFNNSHGLTGSNAFTFSETWWPVNPDDNEWERWHRIFETQDPQANIGTYYTSYGILMLKSCFPSSAIGEWGQPSDTLDPTSKTIYNYKWHWRHIINVMKSHPNNFFIIWTNSPLVFAETNSTEAHFSDLFCRWAKDTLARGLDTQFGAFPRNVYVFDFFHKLADANGFLQTQYASGPNDSHPNAAATELVAPMLVQEMLNAFLAQ